MESSTQLGGERVPTTTVTNLADYLVGYFGATVLIAGIQSYFALPGQWSLTTLKRLY
jgi:hypothetical protein